MITQTIKQKYISYPDLVAKLAELFPGDDAVTIRVSTRLRLLREFAIPCPGFSVTFGLACSDRQMEDQSASQAYFGIADCPFS